MNVETIGDRLDRVERAIAILHKLLNGLQTIMPGPTKLLIGRELGELDAIVREFPK